MRLSAALSGFAMLCVALPAVADTVGVVVVGDDQRTAGEAQAAIIGKLQGSSGFTTRSTQELGARIFAPAPAPTPPDGQALTEAVQAATKSYFDVEYAAAVSQLEDASELVDAAPGRSRVTYHLWRIAAYDAIGKENDAKGAAADALAVQADLSVDKEQYPTRVVEYIENARSAAKILEVELDLPKDSSVWVNWLDVRGRKIRVVPGRHRITVQAPGCRLIDAVFEVKDTNVVLPLTLPFSQPDEEDLADAAQPGDVVSAQAKVLDRLASKLDVDVLVVGNTTATGTVHFRVWRPRAVGSVHEVVTSGELTQRVLAVVLDAISQNGVFESLPLVSLGKRYDVMMNLEAMVGASFRNQEVFYATRGWSVLMTSPGVAASLRAATHLPLWRGQVGADVEFTYATYGRGATVSDAQNLFPPFDVYGGSNAAVQAGVGYDFIVPGRRIAIRPRFYGLADYYFGDAAGYEYNVVIFSDHHRFAGGFGGSVDVTPYPALKLTAETAYFPDILTFAEEDSDFTLGDNVDYAEMLRVALGASWRLSKSYNLGVRWVWNNAEISYEGAGNSSVYPPPQNPSRYDDEHMALFTFELVR